tara:strand:- start:237 stop:575 length:339 start_codon:yes stop_codon:yes gene_type:complete
VSPFDTPSKALTIRILGRDYPIACPDDERETLLNSAEYLSARMEAIQRDGKALGNERIAIMAALNITRELLDLQARQAGTPATTPDEVEQRLADLQRMIEATMASGDEPPSR